MRYNPKTLTELCSPTNKHKHKQHKQTWKYFKCPFKLQFLLQKWQLCVNCLLTDANRFNFYKSFNLSL